MSIALLNTPSLLFEMFPFVFLLTTQVFFVNLLNNNQIQIFKYSGLKNSNIMIILSTLSFSIGIILIIFFYNLSSNLKNFYLEEKIKHTLDGKYLAVITKNGIWIKDASDEEILIINADKIENEYLINTSITRLNNNFQIIENIISEKINVNDFDWILLNSTVTDSKNDSAIIKQKKFKTNFNLHRINNLFSDLSSLTFLELLKLKKDYKTIGYSVDEIDIQAHKFYSMPFLLMLMTVI